MEDYEIYPHVERIVTGELKVISLPAQYKDLAIAAYRASPILRSQSRDVKPDSPEYNIAQMDQYLVRRNYYSQDLYKYTPWSENDQIARALNLKPRDAVFIVAIRKSLLEKMSKV